MKKPTPTEARGTQWRDLRDEQGKLCARLDTKAMVLEIRRSDRKQIARFELREYLVQLQIVAVANKKDTE